MNIKIRGHDLEMTSYFVIINATIAQLVDADGLSEEWAIEHQYTKQSVVACDWKEI